MERYSPTPKKINRKVSWSGYELAAGLARGTMWDYLSAEQTTIARNLYKANSILHPKLFEYLTDWIPIYE